MARWRLSKSGRPSTGGRYPNVTKPIYHGIKFDSGTECERYKELKLLEYSGEIDELELQPRIPIVIGEIQILLKSARYKNGRKLTYVADFRYRIVATGTRVVEDVKMASGHRTDGYRIKRGLLDAMGIEIQEY